MMGTGGETINTPSPSFRRCPFSSRQRSTLTSPPKNNNNKLPPPNSHPPQTQPSKCAVTLAPAAPAARALDAPRTRSKQYVPPPLAKAYRYQPLTSPTILTTTTTSFTPHPPTSPATPRPSTLHPAPEGPICRFACLHCIYTPPPPNNTTSPHHPATPSSRHRTRQAPPRCVNSQGRRAGMAGGLHFSMTMTMG